MNDRVWFFLKIGLCVSTLLGSFFITLSIIDYRLTHRTNDQIRAADAKLIRSALDKYRSNFGKYPPAADNPIGDLTQPLGQYIGNIPDNPTLGLTVPGYRYVSDGMKFGILMRLENGKQCLYGVGTAGTGWWGQPPDCPF